MRQQQNTPAVLEPIVEEAQRRGYLTVNGTRVTYHCRRDYTDNFNDPEEKVRVRTYSRLIIEKSYSPSRINLEVRVPRRTPNDLADIVVYEDDECRVPWLVVENKEEHCTANEQTQGIEQGFGNANSLRAPYTLFDYSRASISFDVRNFPQDERLRNRLGGFDAIPLNYNTPSQFPLVAQGETDTRPVAVAVLERMVRRAHGLIWAGGRRDPLKSFDEWSKLLFAKIYDERHTQNALPRQFQCGVGETATQVANRVRNLYATARLRDPSIFSDPNINLPDDKIRDVVQVVQEVGLSLMSIDGLGHAFEHFFGSIFRGELGQYFTRREIARFMVAMVRPTDNDTILDPTCGSGGFLLETLLQVWHSIDSQYAGQPDLERRKYDFAHVNLFGIEIHEILGRVCQTNLLLHQDGHTNIETDRSCLDAEFTHARLRADGSVFSVAIGNPPFGDSVQEGDSDVLGSNTLNSFEMGRGSNQAKSELIVLERAFDFLRPNGRLAMVIPDGILNNAGESSQCPAFRRYLLRNSTIDAVVSLPDHAFRKSGAQNKTSILFATKFSAQHKADFERVYQDEVNRLQNREAVEAQAEAAETEEADEDAVAGVPAEVLVHAHIQKSALEATVSFYDYPIFFAEANDIGYSPSGTTNNQNDLYSLSAEVPDRTNSRSILGQYGLFLANPFTYQGIHNPPCMVLQASSLFTSHHTYRMDPKFHLFERERLTNPPHGMRLIRLGDVLRRREERVIPNDEPDTEFMALTLSQEGTLSLREPGIGKNPPAWFGQYFSDGSRWFRARANDLIYSQIDLWKGCVTIIPDVFDGAIVTQEFPIYEVDRNHLDPYYLKLVLRSHYFQKAIRAITTGHSNRRRTQSSDFENLTIFAPEDVDEQRQVSRFVRDVEMGLSTQQGQYQDVLRRIDSLIVGQITAAEALA